MFRTVRVFIIGSLFTVHSAMVYVIQVCRHIPLLSVQWINSRTRMELVPSWSCSKAVYKPVWHIPLLSVRWINSWWWTGELSETCRVSWQNECVKLVHLVGFITKKITHFRCLVPAYFKGDIHSINNTCLKKRAKQLAGTNLQVFYVQRTTVLYSAVLL